MPRLSCGAGTGIGWAALLAGLALAGCEPDRDGPPFDPNDPRACIAKSLHDTCAEELGNDYLDTCWDGEGACTWSEDETGTTVLEWKNGTRVLLIGERGAETEIHAAGGAVCRTAQLETSECTGVRYDIDDRWLQLCFELDGAQRLEAYHYTCSNGDEVTVSLEELAATSRMCAQSFMDPIGISDCVNARGQRFADRPAGGRITCPADECPVGRECHANGTDAIAAPDGCNTCECRDGRALCTQGPCGGELGARCYDDTPCLSGLTCKNISADAAVTIGYCTVSCEEDACPDGTECLSVLDRMTNRTERSCMRPCASQADCDPYGSICGTNTGYCN